MDSKQGNAAEFIQAFRSENRAIYRLALDRNDVCDLSAIRVISRGDEVAADLHVLETRRGDLERAVLSIALPDERTSFEVRLSNRMLARMTPDMHTRLSVARDVRMVNPGIDGSFKHFARNHERAIAARCADDISRYPLQPRFSIIVPLYRTPLPYLRAMLQSVLAQSYTRWELILVNASPDDRGLGDVLNEYEDERIVVIPIERNLGIAGNTNIGIRAATGDFISFFDHDDMLHPRILEMYVRAINEQPNADLLYCDEDNFHESLDDRYAPVFKPDFNLDLLYSHNFVVHMLTIARELLSHIELSPDETSGAQDYDLTLKACERAHSIVHVPYLLYHWRAHAGSTNGGAVSNKPYAIAASIKALEDHFARRGLDATSRHTDIPCVFDTTYRQFDAGISVIVCAQSATSLEGFLADIRSQSDVQALEIVAIVPDALASNLPHGCAQHIDGIVSASGGDCAPAINEAARQAKHPLLLICHESVRFEKRDALARLSGCLNRTEVGVVAPKLLYPDGLVAHAGIFVEDRIIGFLNQNYDRAMGGGYNGYAECSCSYSAVGPDCLMTRASTFAQLKGLDTSYGNDLLAVVDYCFRARRANLCASVMPYVLATASMPVLRHATDAVGAYGQTARLEAFWNIWGADWKRDVLFNPNVTFRHGYPNLTGKGNLSKEELRIYAIMTAKRLLGKS